MCVCVWVCGLESISGVLEKLEQMFGRNRLVYEGVQELKSVVQYCQSFGIVDKVISSTIK
jgi:hypothetical protein